MTLITGRSSADDCGADEVSFAAEAFEAAPLSAEEAAPDAVFV